MSGFQKISAPISPISIRHNFIEELNKINDHLLLLVYGDSISLPRPRECITHSDVYPELVRDALESSEPGLRVTVMNRSQGGATVSSLYDSYCRDRAYLNRSEPCVLVIQCGIVDCAPRPVPMSVRKKIAQLPVYLRWLIAKFLHIARPFLLRAGIHWRATQKDEFEALLLAWIKSVPENFTKVYVINIAPTIPEADAHSPGLADSILDFNAAIRRAATISGATYIDVFESLSLQPEGIREYIHLKDGHHITRRGHALYAELLVSMVLPLTRR